MHQVFIGSSSEAKHFAEAIAEVVRESNLFDPLLWWQKGVFKEGLSFLESLFQLITEVDYAILVATPADKTFKRGVKTFEPRDNVVFEYGLFAGRNGRSNVALFRVGDADIMSDLRGISLHHIKMTRGQLNNSKRLNRKKLVELVRADVERCLESFVCSPPEPEALLRDLSGRAVRLLKPDQIRLLAEASRLRRRSANLNPIPPASASRIIEKYCKRETRMVGRKGEQTQVPVYVDLSTLDDKDLRVLAQTIAWHINQKLEADNERLEAENKRRKARAADNGGPSPPPARPTRIGIHYRHGRENRAGLRLMSGIADQLNMPQVFVDLDAREDASVKGDLFPEEEVIFLHDFSVSGKTPAWCINLLRGRNVKVTYLFSFIVHEAKKQDFNNFWKPHGLNFCPLVCLKYERRRPVVTWQDQL